MLLKKAATHCKMDSSFESLLLTVVSPKGSMVTVGLKRGEKQVIRNSYIRNPVVAKSNKRVLINPTSVIPIENDRHNKLTTELATQCRTLRNCFTKTFNRI